MTLHEYLKPMTRDEIQALAERCKTSAGQLKQVAYGNRRPSAALSIDLDRETQGAVTCEELRPDLDWAHVRLSTKPDQQHPSKSKPEAA